MKNSTMTLLPLVFLSGVIVFTYQNCGKGFLGLTDNSGLQCRPAGANTFSESKVQVSSAFVRSRAVNISDIETESDEGQTASARTSARNQVTPDFLKPHLSQTQKEKAVLSEGTKLVALMDVACAYQAQVQGYSPNEYPISFSVPIEKLKRRMRTDQPDPANEFAMPFSLQREVPISEIRAKAEIDKCIIGVGNDSVATRTSTPTITETTGYGRQVFHSAIKTLEGWNVLLNESTGVPDNDHSHDVAVAVIDTGAWKQHTDLIQTTAFPDGSIFSAFNFTYPSGTSSSPGGPFQYPDGSYAYHGTHVAGLIAAPANGVGVVGVAPKHVKIMSLNVFSFESDGAGGFDDSAQASDIYNAIRDATDNGAKILNLSLGTVAQPYECPSPYYLQGVLYAANKGALIIAAAGNGYCPQNTCTHSQIVGANLEDPSQPRQYPAFFAKTQPNVLAVGSSDDRPATLTTKSSFSNYGPSYVAISAPGSSATQLGIYSTSSPQTAPNNTNSTYMYLEGTSMSTPMVSAAAALAYSFYWRRTGQTPSAALLKEFVTHTDAVDHVDALRPYFNQGSRLNVFKMASRLSSLYTSPASAAGSAPSVTTSASVVPFSTNRAPAFTASSRAAPSATQLPSCTIGSTSPTCE